MDVKTQHWKIDKSIFYGSLPQKISIWHIKTDASELEKQSIICCNIALYILFLGINLHIRSFQPVPATYLYECLSENVMKKIVNICSLSV